MPTIKDEECFSRSLTTISTFSLSGIDKILWIKVDYTAKSNISETYTLSVETRFNRSFTAKWVIWVIVLREWYTRAQIPTIFASRGLSRSLVLHDERKITNKRCSTVSQAVVGMSTLQKKLVNSVWTMRSRSWLLFQCTRTYFTLSRRLYETMESPQNYRSLCFDSTDAGYCTTPISSDGDTNSLLHQ